MKNNKCYPQEDLIGCKDKTINGCKKCEEGYYLIENECNKCSNNCTLYKDETGECYKCENNFILRDKKMYLLFRNIKL